MTTRDYLHLQNEIISSENIDFNFVSLPWKLDDPYYYITHTHSLKYIHTNTLTNRYSQPGNTYKNTRFSTNV